MKTTEEIMIESIMEATTNGEIYTKVTKVTNAGKARWIAVYGIKDGRIYDLSREVRALLNLKWSNDGVHLHGYGMPMTSQLVALINKASGLTLKNVNI